MTSDQRQRVAAPHTELDPGGGSIPPRPPHAYQCECGQCRAMRAAILAMTADGEPFYTDEELEAMAEAGTACYCGHCEALRAEIGEC